MRGHRFWRPTGHGQNDAEIQRLRQELTAYNEIIEELEQQHPEGPKIDSVWRSRSMNFDVRKRRTS